MKHLDVHKVEGSSFAECILKNMEKAKTNSGVELIRISCRKLHPDK